LSITASEPLADARSHLRKPRCNVALFEYELTGEKGKFSPEQTSLQSYMSPLVAEEVARQLAERDAEIDRLRVELKCERLERKALEARLGDVETWQRTYSEEIAYDKRRIAALEKSAISTASPPYSPPQGTKTASRIETLRKVLKQKRGGQATFDELKGKLRLSSSQFSQLIAKLDKRIFDVQRHHSNGSKKILVLRQQIGKRSKDFT